MTIAPFVPSRFTSLWLRLSVVLGGLLLPVAAHAQVTYTGSAATQNLGSAAVGSPVSTLLSFSVPAGTTVGSIEVVTQGAPNMDFTNGGGGSCAVQTYGSTTACTVEATFTPMYAGTREGAVLFWSAAGNAGTLLNKTLVYGVGTQAGLTYLSPTLSVIGPSLAGGVTLNEPNGVAFDGFGNMYIADYGTDSNGTNTKLVKIPAGGGNATVLNTTVGGIVASALVNVSVDGAGDLFVMDANNNRILEYPVGGGATISLSPVVASTPLDLPQDAIVGPSGVLYIADSSNNRLLEIPNLGTGTGSAITTAAGEAFNYPSGVALNTAGDVYVADETNIRVVELGGAGSVWSATIPGVGTTLTDMYGIVVDPLNNLFISDLNENLIVEVPGSGSSGSVLNTTVGGKSVNGPGFMALDNPGNLYIADYGNARVIKVTRTSSAPVATHFSVSAPANATAGVSFNVTVTALSASNATVTGYTGTVEITSSDGSAILPGNAGLTNGVGTFAVTLKTLGSQSVTATDTVHSSITGSTSVLVNPGAATHLSVSAPATATTGVPINFTVTALDQFSNTATGYTGTVHFTSTDGAATMPANYTFTSGDAGTHTFSATLNSAGNQTITATDTTNVSVTGTSGLIFASLPEVQLTTVANPVAGGSVTPASGNLYSVGTVVPITATANTGYTFLGWTSGPDAVASATSASTTIPMNAAETVTAQFSANLVVNTTSDDNPGVAANCFPQASPGVTSTADNCSLRDALTFAAGAGAASITFDSTVFATAQTIALGSAGTLIVPANTSITGPTSGTGYTLTNLVTVSGAGASGVFRTGSAAVALSNLAIVNGYTVDGGGILNDHGVVTVANCTFINNTATDWGGGIFNNHGTTTVTGSTFSGNSASSYGGGLMNFGTATIANSTFNGNSTPSDGGGIFNDDTLTVSSSTLSGNTAAAGGGIFWSGGTNVMANSIVTGNLAPSEPDTSGFSDHGGNRVTTGFVLAPLGSYGGPTQTMVPLPGDPSLCGGTLANATAAGLTTDQRGFPLESHCPAGSVDSGAVQTNYTLGFAPLPLDVIEGQVITPAPAVTLYETGRVSATPTNAVTISDSGATLSGTLTQNLVAGTATFSGVSFTSLGFETELMATMALTSTINITGTRGATVTSSPVPAVISAPSTSAILPGPAVTFTWNAVSGATGYSLWIGTAGVGSNNLYDSGEVTGTSLKFGNLPTNGATVYVRIYTNYFGVVGSNDYVYTASTQAALKSPSSPGVLAGAKVTFTWSAATGSGVTGYSLWLGSSQGGDNLYLSGETTALSATATKLPTNSSTVYARIYTNYNGVVRYTDTTYTAAP